MPKIKVIKPFKFAHLGYQVEEFEPSDEPRETTQEVVDTLKNEGFFKVVKERAGDQKPAGEASDQSDESGTAADSNSGDASATGNQ